MTDSENDAVVSAEQSALGAALLSADALDVVCSQLSEGDFYSPKHSLIFTALQDLRSAGKPVDPVTVMSFLSASGELSKAGGAPYLHELVSIVPTTANASYYTRAIQEASARRRIHMLGLRAQQYASTGQGMSPEELLGLLQRELDSISDSAIQAEDPTKLLGDILGPAVDAFEAEAQKGVSSGFPDLDRLTNGWQNGQMIIVAARPGVGKSTASLDFARQAAIRDHIPTAIFALEMSRTEVIQRLVSAEASVSLTNIRKGELNEDEWTRIGNRLSLMMQAPLYIDDTPGITLSEIRSRLRRISKRQRIGLVIIDYLQLMRSSGRIESRQQEVSEISRGVKLLAKELGVPIIVMSQLNRGPENRTDKKPQLSDLRESGSLEQDADLVLLLFREDMQDENSPRQGEADFILAKQRQGPTGTVPVVAALHHSKFLPLAQGF